MGFPGGSGVNNHSANSEDVGWIPWLGKSSEEGNGNTLQYSCLENSMYRESWKTIILGVAKNLTRLSN